MGELETLLHEERIKTLRKACISHLPKRMQPEDAGRIISNGPRHNEKELEAIIKAVAKAAREYLREHKGITSGELMAAASNAYNCSPWQVKEAIIQQEYAKFPSFKKRMEENTTKSKIYEHLPRGAKLRYRHVIRPNNNYWHDKREPEHYINKHLIDKESLEEPTRTENKRTKTTHQGEEERHERRTNGRKEEQETIPEAEQTMTIDDYVKRYRLRDNDFPNNDTMDNNKDSIERYLKDAGLRGEEKLKQWRKVLSRNIIRNYELQRTLYKEGTENISQQKLHQLARLFRDSKEFRKDTDRLFSLVKE